MPRKLQIDTAPGRGYGRRLLATMSLTASTESHFADGTVQLWGFDFGSTTCSAAAASARLAKSAVSGRVELQDLQVQYCSPITLTPRCGDLLDLAAIDQLLQRWLTEGKLNPQQLFGGGTLITGLAARSVNVAELRSLLTSRIGLGLIATAAEPCLESWVAFMAGSAELSRQHPSSYFLNLDIGGGTANLALGHRGSVLSTGALLVGARHLQVHPGSYQLTAISEPGAFLLSQLGIPKQAGDTLTASEVRAVLAFQIRALEACVSGNHDYFFPPQLHYFQEVPLTIPGGVRDLVPTYTGGVGELVYRILRSEPLPSQTAFGDLGIELAQAIVCSPTLMPKEARTLVPTQQSRATLYGMMQHGTEVSGTTLYLPNPQLLPLYDLPILGKIGVTESDDRLDALLRLALLSPAGACIQIDSTCTTLEQVRHLASQLQAALFRCHFPATLPLVLLLAKNIGKLLGSYITRWGQLPLKLVAVDEISDRNMAFVSLGALRNQVLPISLYGMNR